MHHELVFRLRKAFHMSWSRFFARKRDRQAVEAQALRRAVAELPASTRAAMLAAIDGEELIIGAYADRRGRACPMLAAHRRGARTDVGSFPKAWDAFGRARRPRPATRRELEVLKALLQESFQVTPGAPGAPGAPGSHGAPAAPAPTARPTPTRASDREVARW